MTGAPSGQPARLALATLARLRPGARGPAYDPRRCSIGHVHLGLGNFHRAHQAVHADAALASGEHRWAIAGVNLRNPARAAALGPQDGLYTLLEREASGTRARIIGSIRQTLCAHSQPNHLLERLAVPETRIVSLTITEKGYGIAHDGALDVARADIAADLQGGWPPRSALGWLAAGIRERMNRHPQAGLTLLSCDNLSRNGQTLQQALRQFLLAQQATDSVHWIERHASFPDSMVDRIVPATTHLDEQQALALTGLEDAWPVGAEGFSQWVLEDRFAAGRPDWARSGVKFTTEVAGWELMKLRLLNAAHSCIAYLGDPAGFDTVDTAISSPEIRAFVDAFWRNEASPCLPASVRPLALGYCQRLLDRFDNPAIGHRTRQIAMDGSMKIPLRWLPTLRMRLEQGQPVKALCFAIAAWIRYLAGIDERGRRYPVVDPAADRLGPLATQADPALAARSVMHDVGVFGDLGQSQALTREIAGALASLRELGSTAALRKAGWQAS